MGYDTGLGLLQGLQRGIGSYFDATKAREDREAQAREKELAYQAQGLIPKKDATGLIVGFERDPSRIKEEQMKQINEAALDGKMVEYTPEGTAKFKGYSPEYIAGKRELNRIEQEADPLARALKATQLQKAQADVERDKVLSQGPEAEGYARQSRAPISEAESKEIKSMNKSYKNFKSLMDSVKNKVAAADPKDLANPFGKTRKSLDQDLTNLKLLYKSDDFAKLGVLAGPDLQILEKSIESPGLLNMFSGGGKDAYVERLGQAQQTVDQKRDATLSEYGYKPTQQGILPSNAGAAQLSAQDQQALDWASQNPSDPRAKAIKQKLGVR